MIAAVASAIVFLFCFIIYLIEGAMFC